MNDILSRFADLEEKIVDVKTREVFLDNNRIVFQTAKSDSVMGSIGCTTMCVGVSLLVLMAAQSFLSCCGDFPFTPIVVWFLTICAIAILMYWCFGVWKSSLSNGKFRQYKVLEIDIIERTITSFPLSEYHPQVEQTIRLDDLYCFYAWHVSDGDSTTRSVYAVDEKDRTTVLCRDSLPADKTAQILGFLCDKPVFLRNEDLEIKPLTEISSAMKTSDE